MYDPGDPRVALNAPVVEQPSYVTRVMKGGFIKLYIELIEVLVLKGQIVGCNHPGTRCLRYMTKWE